MNWCGGWKRKRRNGTRGKIPSERKKQKGQSTDAMILFLFFVVGLVTKQALTGFIYAEKFNSIELVIESHNTICTFFECFAGILVHHAVYIESDGESSVESKVNSVIDDVVVAIVVDVVLHEFLFHWNCSLPNGETLTFTDWLNFFIEIDSQQTLLRIDSK